MYDIVYVWEVDQLLPVLHSNAKRGVALAETAIVGRTKCRWAVSRN